MKDFNPWLQPAAWLLAVAAGFASPPVAVAQDEPPAVIAPKLIQFGWGMPTPDVLRAQARQLDRVPFDGVAVALHAGFPVLKHDPYPEQAFEADRAELAAFHSDVLTENFVMMWATTEPGWDWASERDWTAAAENVRNFARSARAGRFRGIVLDAEPYGPSPWDFSKLPVAAGTSFESYAALVYERGRRFIRIVESELPNASILMPWGPVSVMDRTHAPRPGPLRNEFLKHSAYGLFPAFARGMLEGSTDAKFIDGDEASYYYVTEKDFATATRRLDEAVRTDIAAASGPGHAARYRIGQAIYADWILDPAGNATTLGHYLDGPQQQLAVLELAVQSALAHADSYVWVYSERLSWWNGPFPEAAAASIRRARDRALRGRPEPVDLTSVVQAARDRLRRATPR